jgi:2-keto-4-pentenoate hydratase
MATRVRDAARLLIDARRSGQRLRALPEAATPRDYDEAYAIQKAVVAGLDERIAGYKISYSAEGGTMVAPILAGLMVASGAERSLAPADKIAIELEFGFRFGRAVAVDATRSQVLDAIEAMVVTLELCDTRFESLEGLSKPVMIADLVSNRGAVPGAAVPFDANADFKGATCRQLFDGVVNTERTGSHPNGDPLLPLAALPRALGEHGYTLGAGQFVITGSLTGITWVRAPLNVRGEIDGFGTVAVTLAI